MKLIEAAVKIDKILRESIDKGSGFYDTLSKIKAVKVHGMEFTNSMLLEVMLEYAKNFSDFVKTEEDIQEMFDKAESSWNKKFN
jgi:hypothetical protein|tara:strand:+ start:363 stop:614 length:252 start_codon:yes stop_codon:yes gene_type:complete